MGVRLYDPVTGRFLSPDSVYGGNANAYTYPADPVNKFDLDGRKAIAKYNKTSFKCSTWSCTLKLSRKKTDRLIDTLAGLPKLGAVAAAIATLAGGVTPGRALLERVLELADLSVWPSGEVAGGHPDGEVAGDVVDAGRRGDLVLVAGGVTADDLVAAFVQDGH